MALPRNAVQWKAWMRAGDQVILDGSTGSELVKRGARFGDSKMWAGALITSAPHMLETLAFDYLCAGADVVTTATYQATVQLIRDELDVDEEEARRVLRSAVRPLMSARERFWQALSEEERSRRRYPVIAGSLGPLAAFMKGENEYEGTYEAVRFETFVSEHEKRVHAVLGDPNERPDVLAFETVPCASEAKAITRLMSQAEVRYIPYWLAFQCRDEARIANGTLLAEAIKGVLEASTENLVAVGVNCVLPSHARALVAVVRDAVALFFRDRKDWGVSIIVAPNSGEHPEGENWVQRCEKLSDKDAWARSCVATGARIVGGCCRVGPEFVKSLRSALGDDSGN